MLVTGKVKKCIRANIYTINIHANIIYNKYLDKVFYIFRTLYDLTFNNVDYNINSCYQCRM